MNLAKQVGIFLTFFINISQVFTFNADARTPLFIRPNQKSSAKWRNSVYFGYSFSIRKSEKFYNYAVGAPKTTAVLQDLDAAPPGRVFVKQATKMDRSVRMKVNKRSSAGTSFHNVGQSITHLQDGTILSCLPAEELRCSDLVFSPGSCIQTRDRGRHWEMKTAPPICPVIKLDLIFLLDASGSVTEPNFKKVQSWTKNLAKFFFHKRWQSNLGVITYTTVLGNYIPTEIKLGEFHNGTAFNASVDKIKYKGGTTPTAHALNKTVEEFKSSKRFHDPLTSKVMILLTDGKTSSNSKKYLRYSVKYVGDNKIVIFCIGVGSALDKDELELIAGGQENVFMVQNFQSLNSIVEKLERKVYKLSLEGKSSNNEAVTKLESAEIGFSVSNNEQV